MMKTRLSSKGRVTIPKSMRTRHHWETGQEIVAVDMDEAILLRPKSSFPEKTLNEIVGCLRFTGPAKTREDMEEAIREGAVRMTRDGRGY